MTEQSRILFLGVTSIHGWPFYQTLRRILPLERLWGIRPPKMKIPDDGRVSSICVSDYDSLLKIKDLFQPTHVVCCSGVCDLDVCEERPEWASRINTTGAKNVAEIFGTESYILFAGSDLVYSGNNPPAGGYTENHPPDPIHIAGRTIAAAEKEISNCAHYSIFRLGLPLGDSITGGKGAFDWIRSRFKKNLPVTLFTDEYRSAISCEEITDVLLKALQNEWEGLFHLGGENPISLFEIGKMVLNEGNFSADLLKGIMRHEEKNGPPRIGNVALNSSKIRSLIGNN
jgi:dTDP-4-dehydrorhamnose reductase